MKLRLPAFLAALFAAASTLHAADGALSFTPASSQYVNVPNFHTLGVTNEVTIEFWAWTNAAGNHSAFMLETDDGANRCQMHTAYSDGQTYWDFGDIAGGGRLQVATPGGTIGVWTHYAVVATQSGNAMRMYVNGALVAAKVGMNDFGTAVAKSLRIGGNTGSFFNGRLDEFRVWNVARTAAEIAAYRGVTLSGGEPGLRLYFKFDEASGTTAVNSATATGSARDGTLTNTPARIAGPTTAYSVTSAANTGAGTLRQAFTDAAAAAGPGLITFAAGLNGQTITLSSEIVIADAGGVTVDATSLADGLTLHGGAGTNRVLSISAAGNVILHGLNLTGGDGNGATNNGLGGAVRNAGTLVASRCTFYGNTTAEGSGGAIYSTGSLTLTQCTISGNSAGTFGGGLYTSGSVSLTHVTLGNNTAAEAGAAMYLISGTLTLAHSAISGTIANNGTITRVGTSIVQSAPGGTLNGTGTLTVADPLLAALGDYGGPTLTMRTSVQSPARDAATGSAITADQRGFPVVGPADIGAYECQLGAIAAVTVNEDTTTGALPFSAGTVGTLTASSSNTALVPNASLTLGGSGGSRTITALPATNASGATTITVTDSLSGEATSFLLTVTAVNDAPTATRLNDGQTYTEETERALSNIVITDVDSEVTATLTLSTTAAGSLSAGTSGAVTSTFNAGTGVWSAAGPVANVNALLADIIFVPAANFDANFTIATRVSDGVAAALTGTKNMTAIPVNDAPAISAVADQLIQQSTSTAALSFTVSDVDTAAASLTATGVSLNTALVPHAGIVITAGAGGARTVVVTPAAGQSGTATIRLTVTDTNSATAVEEFVLTVNAPPVISEVGAQSIDEDTNTGDLAFTVSDALTAAESLTVTRTSSNTTLVPLANVVLGGSGENRTVRVTPAANLHGSATITLTAPDGSGGSSVRAFSVTVAPVNDPPTFTKGADRAHLPDAGPQTVPGWATALSKGPANENTQTLTGFTISSNSNAGLFSVPPAVALNGTLTYTPAAGMAGEATIGVTLSDDGGGTNTSAEQTFVIRIKLPIMVTNAGNTGTGSLRQAVATAAVSPGGDFIHFAPGLSDATITLTPEIVLDDNLALDASSLPRSPKLSGGNANRIFWVRANRTVSLRGLTLTGGISPATGGAIYNQGTLALTDCALSGNTVNLLSPSGYKGGGAIHSESNTTLTLNRCSLTGNTVTTSGSSSVIGVGGGAIFSRSGSTLTLTQCSFSGNDAYLGGGPSTAGGGQGGAVVCLGTSTITQCSFSGNRAGFGGAIYNGDPESVATSGTLTLTHCTLAGNTAISAGGAIRNRQGTATITHCTLTGNTAPASNGSGVACFGSFSGVTVQTKLRNTVVSGNNASSVDATNGPATTITSLGGNVIGSGNASSRFNQSGDVINNAPQLAALADNGGPTQTCALIPGSPAINKITTPLFTTDQRGFPVVDAADSGAYEFGSASIAPIADQAILPDTQASVPYSLFREGGAVITVTSSDQTLLPDAAIARSSSVAGINETGTLTLTPAAGQFGSTTISLSVTQGSLTVTETFVLRVGSISPPEIAPLADVTVFEDQSSDFIPLVITDADSPPEAIVLSYTTSDPQLVNLVQFSAGQFRVFPGWNLSGTASITISASDGLNTTSRTFQFTVVETNDPPAFTAGGHFWLPPGSGAQTVTEWATGISAGPSDESSQTLAFTVTTDNDALFSVLPAVSPAGTLTFTPAPGQTGAANVTVTLTDSGSNTAPSYNSTSRTLCIAIRQPLLVTTAAGDNSPGSLLAAIALASTAGHEGPDALHFAPALSGQTITLSDQISIQSPHDLELDATALPGGLTLDAGPGDNRHFQISYSAQLTLRGLSLTGGDGDSGQGGSIENSGRLTLVRCTFFGNTATNDGGAIRNNWGESVLHATHCTFSGNRTLINSGGAIRNNSHAVLIHCTLAGNIANSDGGAVDNHNGHLLMAGCIVAGNTAGSGFDLDNSATLTFTGSNLVPTLRNIGTITGPAPLTAPALLAPLASYGGSTMTMSLLPGSPARDAATGSTITTDQRGFPIVGLPDIGSYEAGTIVSFATWAAETHGLMAIGFGNDNDLDGLSDGEEYAAGGNPLAYTPTPLTATPAPGGGMVFTFPWNPLAPDLRYRLQESTDLGTWSDLYQNDRTTSQITRAPGVTSDETTTPGLITVTVPPATGARTFWRLHIEQP